MAAAFEVTTRIAATPGVVFALALDMEQHAASLARSDESAVTSHGRAALGLGDRVTFTARHLGRRWTMTSQVTVYEPPRRFVDEQVRGPFRQLVHEHLFLPESGGTRMVDRVSFAAPLGVVGRAAELLGLTRYFERLIRERGAYIKHQAESWDSQKDPG